MGRYSPIFFDQGHMNPLIVRDSYKCVGINNERSYN